MLIFGIFSQCVESVKRILRVNHQTKVFCCDEETPNLLDNCQFLWRNIP